MINYGSLACVCVCFYFQSYTTLQKAFEIWMTMQFFIYDNFSIIIKGIISLVTHLYYISFKHTFIILYFFSLYSLDVFDWFIHRHKMWNYFTRKWFMKPKRLVRKLNHTLNTYQFINNQFIQYTKFYYTNEVNIKS